ncbi:MAG: lysophospholipase [Nevskia sp.]|uniref:lysophospholipase n=1 Tax=Nevskia sp. TaxID=1929292 RepID=UPI0040370C97
MKHSEGHFDSVNKIRIHFQTWAPSGAPKATVVIAHGLGEHGGRYREVATQLVGLGCVVHAIDHRGHGKSGGARTLIDKFSNAVADLDTLIDRARRLQPAVPLFLLGHSMGGALSLSYAIKHGSKLEGLILSGPAVALDGAPPLLGVIAKTLASFAPKLGMFQVDPSLVSRDPDEVAKYAGDPLNAHGKVPVRTLAEIVRFVEIVPAMLPVISVPTLLLHGSDDKLAGVAGSRMVFERISSPDKTLKVYDGLYHEIFNELPADRARVFKDLTDWLQPRLAA